MPHAEFTSLCTAPCSTAIRAGTHQLGLSLDGKTVAPARTIDLQGSVELEGVIASRTSLRVAGVLLALASAVGGYLLAAFTLASPENNSGTAGHLGGLAIILIGTPIGIGMAFTPDRADVRIK